MTREQIDSIMERFALRNARFAVDYEVDGEGVLFRDDPVDRFVRPMRAAWTDLDPDERRKVTDFVRCRLGLNLPDGKTTGRGAHKRPGQVTLETLEAELAVTASKGLRDWVRAAWTAGFEIALGLGQIRLSGRGLLILRWLRWRLYRLLQRACSEIGL